MTRLGSRRQKFVVLAVVICAGAGVGVAAASAGDDTRTTGNSVATDDGSIESAITNAEFDIPGLYSGATYHPADGHFSIRGPIATMDRLREYFRAHVDGDAFDAIEFVGVERSWSELQAIQREVVGAIDWFDHRGLMVSMTSVRPELGKVRIWLVDYSAAAGRAVLAHFGADRVVVVDESTPLAKPASRR